MGARSADQGLRARLELHKASLKVCVRADLEGINIDLVLPLLIKVFERGVRGEDFLQKVLSPSYPLILLTNYSSANNDISVVKHDRLSFGGGALGLVKLDRKG